MFDRLLGRFPKFAYRFGLGQPDLSAERSQCENSGTEKWHASGGEAVNDVHMTAWSFAALEVVSRKLRRFSLVSDEKAYRRDFEDCHHIWGVE